MENILQFFMGTVDTLMVSHLGDSAVSAVGVSNQILQSVLTLFSLVNAGAGIVIARRWGAGNMHDVRRASLLVFQANLLAGLVSGILLALFAGPVLGLIKVPDLVFPLALTYLTIVGAGTVLISLQMVLGMVIRAGGDTRSPMVVTVAMNLVHLGLNAVFLFGLGPIPSLGVAGTAVSTLASRSLAVAALFILVDRVLSFRSFMKDPRRAGDQAWPLWREVLSIGVPVSVTVVSWGFSQVCLTAVVASLGAASLAAYTYLTTVQQYPWVIAVSVGGAAHIRISHFWGAGKKREAHAEVGRALVPGLPLCLGASALMALGGSLIFSWFTRDAQVVSLALPVMVLCVVWHPLRIVAFTTSGALNTVGQAPLVALLTVLGMWFVALGGAWLFTHGAAWGLVGVFIALIADEVLRGTVFSLRWRKLGRVWAEGK